MSIKSMILVIWIIILSIVVVQNNAKLREMNQELTEIRQCVIGITNVSLIMKDILLLQHDDDMYYMVKGE